MANGPLAPIPRMQFFDDLGAPLAGGKIYTFLTGSGTQSPIYTDAALSVAHPNPAILDAAGRITIYMTPNVSQLWQIATATALPGVFLYQVDPVTPPNIIAPIADQFQLFEFAGSSTTTFANTTYPAGATFDKLHVGTAVLAIDPDTLPTGITYVIRAMVLGTNVSVGVVDLSGGSPDTPIATATGNFPTGVGTPGLIESGVITFPAGGSTHRFGIKVKVASGNGTVWSVKLSQPMPV